MARVQVSAYRKSETTSNTVISNCEKRNFRRSSDLAEAKIYLFAVFVIFDMPSTDLFFWFFCSQVGMTMVLVDSSGVFVFESLSCCFLLKCLLFVQLPLSSLSCPGSSCLPLLLTSFLLSPSSQPPITCQPEPSPWSSSRSWFFWTGRVVWVNNTTSWGQLGWLALQP